VYLNNKSVFVAGSTGCAGSSIIRHIINNYPAAKIRAAYYKHTEPFIRHERVEYVFGDLKSQNDCKKMVKGCDCAIMAAANTAGSNVIVSQPWEHINDNLIMNAVMLEAFHSEDIKRIVYIGSATLYQETEGHIKEDSLDLNKEPHTAYFGFAWVVRFIEKLCKFWHDKYGMEILIARAANIFGPYAKFDPATSNFIPAIIRKAVDKMDPFDVWGSADVTRDIIYSEDFARAIMMMMDNDKIGFDVFNIGTGIKTTVNNVVQLALKCAGHEPSRIQYSEDKPTTSKFRALDCTKASELLGWQPQFTIEQGISKTTEWWIQNKDWWSK